MTQPPNQEWFTGEATRQGRGPDAAKAAAVAEMTGKARRAGYNQKLGANLFEAPTEVRPGVWKAKVKSKFHR